ncbi:phosphoribosyltransferase [Phormidesmis priestleyi ULC007]|uniref:Phosphoribosyltransferase n=1 Tax=Phormidesmis priestleyi ULC007 TaxID=1920490 RepID=A0A2T1DEJ3_9CYAN|nr:phosphoribosyltransferase family protein [Phormidesmis priestleyi]PSB18861.1 phosphoribosyltransferase [Phormidesmis priestleyi ULC007]PZO51001.1 MAG: phosphoribosyltransferase [Phormidesmis priestleyi]
MTLSQLFQGGNATIFVDRHDAGEKLAQAVLTEAQTLPESTRFVVYALPRGGLPVAAPVARALGCPLDVIVAKKITRPENSELAIGAVTADGHVLWLKSSDQVQEPNREAALLSAQKKAQAQLARFGDRPDIDPEGAIALLVDDGIATGMTMAVAVKALRTRKPLEIWICAPVAPQEMVNSLGQTRDLLEPKGANRAIILATPDPFWSVSRFYQVFTQVETEEALACLQNFYQN